jgi:hypothetical protein
MKSWQFYLLGEPILMQDLLSYVEKEKIKFSQLPFLQFLRDSSINPKHRLAFAPCAAPFIMSFGELNRSVFRVEPTVDPIQSTINQHTYEDDCHWMWFLEDLERVGLNSRFSFPETLRLLWSKELSASRLLSAELYRLTAHTDSLEKLVIISVIEATGNAFLEASSQTIHDLDPFNKMGFKYFGSHHLEVDAQHDYILGKKFSVQDIQVSAAKEQQLHFVVDQVFSLFTQFVASLLSFAEAERLNPSICSSLFEDFSECKLMGQYLVEAELITSEQLQDALDQQKTISIPLGQILSIKGWVKQGTLEFFIDRVINPERQVQVLEKTAQPVKRTGPVKSMSPGRLSAHLGTFLIDAELITEHQLEIALSEQKMNTLPIGQILSGNGFVKQQTIEYLMQKVVIPERDLAVK